MVFMCEQKLELPCPETRKDQQKSFADSCNPSSVALDMAAHMKRMITVLAANTIMIYYVKSNQRKILSLSCSEKVHKDWRTIV